MSEPTSKTQEIELTDFTADSFEIKLDNKYCKLGTTCRDDNQLEILKAIKTLGILIAKNNHDY